MNAKRFAITLTWGMLGMILALVWGLVSSSHLAYASDLTVCPAGPPDCQYSSVQAAVDAASDGSVIKVAEGEYAELHVRPRQDITTTGTVTQVVYISKTISIKGGYTAPGFSEPPDPYAHPSILDAQGQGRVIYVTGDVSATIKGLRITNGDAAGLRGGPWNGWPDSGGGIYVYRADANIANNWIFGNTAYFGGGLGLLDSRAMLTSNTVVTNTAGAVGGGLYLSDSSATILGNTVASNEILLQGFGASGGGLHLRRSNAILIDNTVAGNTSTCFGGGFYSEESTATLRANTIVANKALDRAGGGVFLDHSDATLSANTIATNTANWHGGGMYMEYSTAAISNTAFISNSAGWGGGLYLLESSATVLDNQFSDNTAFAGGGVSAHASKHVTLTGNSITANSARYGEGGGLRVDNCWCTISNNTVVSNTTAASGGGLYVYVSPGLVSGNTVRANKADENGGGLFMFSSATLSGNSVIGNTALGSGGGVYLAEDQYTLINNLVADNRAEMAGSGLFIETNGWGRPPTLIHTTVARNLGSAGIHVTEREDQAHVMLTDTILVSHTVGISVTAGNTVTMESTLWGTTTWANETDWAGAGTIVTGTINLWEDPDFIDSAHGDYHIDIASGARDSGIDAGVLTDIDGESRPYGPGCDIGADELAPRLAVTKRANVDAIEYGIPITYSLYVSNTGPLSLTATITDLLPIYATPSGQRHWQPPIMLPGEVWTETIVVTVDEGYIGPLTNVVRVTTDKGATGAFTHTLPVEERIAGLIAENNSPTHLFSPTTLTATVAAGSNVACLWSFGDGVTGFGPVTPHTYPGVGTYTAVVTASNPLGALAATTRVTITDVPIAGLVASNDGPTPLGSATTMTATVTAGSNVSYTWDLGDGHTKAGPVVTHGYAATGNYTAVVTASNPANELAVTMLVTVTRTGFDVYLPLVLRETSRGSQ